MATHLSMSVFAFFPSLGPMELLIVGAIAVLLFGNRLPSVMRSLGQSFVEFKKGVGSIESEIRSATSERNWNTPRPYENVDDRREPSAPKFEPPPAATETAAGSDAPADAESTTNVEST